MKNLKQFIFLLVLFLYNNSITNAQTYDVYPILENGTTDERINFVVMADGYTASELIDFQADAQKVSDDLFQTSPFKEYKSFFNFYGIGSISNESGVDHPGTATDVVEPASPIIEVDNLLTCSYDRANIHRLLSVENSTNANTVLANNFPAYDEKLILCNSSVYGGAGGAFAVASTNVSSSQIMIHEIGHSFAGLGDEYWAGDNFIGERPNRTQQSDPNLVKWKNWIAEQGIGVYQHCCSAVASEWYRPHQSCKMRSLNSPFCAVCKEAFINSIYSLVSPIRQTTPAEGNISVSTTQVFSLDLILPNPNTLVIEWMLNGSSIGNGTSVTIDPSSLGNNNNVLTARVEDETPMSRTYLNGNPLEFFATWNLTRSAANDCPNSIDGYTVLGEFGNSKYYLSNNISKPMDAKAAASSLGGHLVSIGSSAENDFIQQNISEMVYIGLNDQAVEGDLNWFNGESVFYSNIDPCGFCNANSEDQDFVIIAPWDGKWSFSNFYNQRKYIVEIPCDVGNPNLPDLTLSNLRNVASNMTVGEVEYFEFDLKNIGNATATASYAIRMYVSTDANWSSNDVLAGEIITANTSVGTDPNVPAAITVPDLTDGNYYLLVVADANNAITESNENNNTIAQPITIGNSSNNCQTNTINGFTFLGEFGNSQYYLSNSEARPTDGQAKAESVGGFLASITSQAENDFVQQNINGLVYFGLQDENNEGDLRWWSGEALNYTNFDECSFCESNSEEMDYVVMQAWNGGWSYSNFWNQRKYVMEIPCSPNFSPNNTLVLLPEDKDGKPTFIQLVPNPVNEFIGVQLDAEHEMNIDIQIFNARGRKVKEVSTSLFKGLNGVEIVIAHLPSGVYWVKIPQAQYYNSTKRFVKVNE